MKWINDKRASFATRLVAAGRGNFFLVHSVLFSGLKARINAWLCFSNELISRDEALHTEFAVLLYKKLKRKCVRIS